VGLLLRRLKHFYIDLRLFHTPEVITGLGSASSSIYGRD